MANISGSLYEQIRESSQFIQQLTDFQPLTGIVLGTGLSGLTKDIDVVCSIHYGDIPHFPVSTVQSHQGKLILGSLAGEPVAAMAGRFHYYEGYTMQQVTFPVRVMKSLGCERIIVSNAAGGVNPAQQNGDLVFISDHINLLPENPLRGPNDERLGPRFPDLSDVYDKEMLRRAIEIATANGIRAHTGVYVALQGPNLETPAEYAYVHRIGGDLVGMSTVPEVLVAKHSGMKVFAVSIVTDKGYPPHEIRETSVEDVIAVAEAAAPKMALIVKALLKEMRNEGH
jgi:purine-nucleoside phosphorylase